MFDPVFTTFGDCLRYARARLQLTQEELGRLVGYTGAHISHLEHNGRLPPDEPTLKARFVPALQLEAVPDVMVQFLELAEQARREPPNKRPPDKWTRMQEEWKALLLADEEAMRTKLNEEAMQLTSGQIPEEGLRLLEHLLCGYMVFVEHRETNDPLVAKAMADYIPRLGASDDARKILALLSKSITQLCWKIRETQSSNLYSDVHDLSRGAWHFYKTYGANDEELFAVTDLFRAAAFLKEHHYLEPQDITDLVSWLDEVSQCFKGLRAADFHTLYLEELGQFLEAAVTSEEAALLARRHGHLDFSAALYARAAKTCKEVNKYLYKAAELFKIAADIMTRDGRLSIKAAEYYNAASDLLRNSPDHDQIKEKARELEAWLKEVNQLADAKVIIVANDFDMEFADLLVDVLAKYNIACELKRSSEVEDLTNLTNCAGIIIVGGIKARDTGQHLRQHFYMVPPVRGNGEKRTFKWLDIEQTHYCDIWNNLKNPSYTPALIKPTYVLAGLTRIETLQAVYEFVHNDELEKFVKAITEN